MAFPMGVVETCWVPSGITVGAAGGRREGFQRGALEFRLLKWEMSFSSRKAMYRAAGRSCQLRPDGDPARSESLPPREPACRAVAVLSTA